MPEFVHRTKEHIVLAYTAAKIGHPPIDAVITPVIIAAIRVIPIRNEYLYGAAVTLERCFGLRNKLGHCEIRRRRIVVRHCHRRARGPVRNEEGSIGIGAAMSINEDFSILQKNAALNPVGAEWAIDYY